ncbi:DUF2442 domain-containing protein [Acidobacteria bacterium ACD]|nr:MAG: DUF2442 domain-containing protein [Acidobacteriota bacterium]MCE7960476.1 DUF2442 domain-containing protein [Acidobacteria bacterium ACB2]MDL1951296.1 DUF2442 domain-containing protein [Acidobacteria bacterium ACD]
MNRTPTVTSAEHLGDHRLLVTFSDGTRKAIDFTRWLKGPVFEPLKDPEYFRRFIVDGWTVSWPNGADIAPEALYDYAEESRPAA